MEVTLGGDTRGGSTAPRPGLSRQFNQSPVFFLQDDSLKKDQSSKIKSAANTKAVMRFCFPESSFGVTSAKCYRCEDIWPGRQKIQRLVPKALPWPRPSSALTVLAGRAS